jgi:hypothetical protein
MRRWIVVGAVGVLCGLLLGWLLWAMTASLIPAVVVGAGVAAILLVLAVGGATHNATFARSPDRGREAEAKRRRVQDAMEQTRRDS